MNQLKYQELEEQKELIKRAQLGDEDAFTKLILKMRHNLYKIAKMRLINDADVEDAVQDTMLAVYENIAKLKDINAFKQWTITILINKCNKIYNKRGYRNLVPEEEIDKYIQVNNENLSKSDLDFYYLIKKLSYEERMVLTLQILEDYPIKTISEILKMNENTVKTKLSRAKEKLRNDYEENN